MKPDSIDEHIQKAGYEGNTLVLATEKTEAKQRYDVSTIYVGEMIHEFVAYNEGTQVVNQAVTDYLNKLLHMTLTNTTKSNFNQQMLQRFLAENCNVD